MLQATTVQHTEELAQILTLQEKNLIRNIDSEEMRSQGFVTVHHTMDVLEKMHALAPSVIIKDNEEVVAYALTMPRATRQLVPTLEPMFAVLDQLQYKGRPLNDYRFYVMGQICVDKAYRGQGLFDKLYQHHRDTFQPSFDFILTEIATRNTRSIRAHERVGFKTIHTHRDDLDEWQVVVWDWLRI